MHDAPWFHAEDISTDEVTLSESESRHAGGSRRLRAGEPVTLFDGRGGLAHGKLHEARGARERRSTTALTVVIREREQVARPIGRLTLISAAPKGARLDFLVEKCTELGVGALWLAGFERSVARPATGHVEKLRRVVTEACKQCRRAWRMKVEALDLDAALEKLGERDPTLRLAAHLSDEARSIRDAIQTGLRCGEAGAVLIGPEGGLTVAEVERLRSGGWELVRLADHVLRVETAAVAAAAIWASATA